MFPSVPKLEGECFRSYFCPETKKSWERTAVLEDQIRN